MLACFINTFSLFPFLSAPMILHESFLISLCVISLKNDRSAYSAALLSDSLLV